MNDVVYDLTNWIDAVCSTCNAFFQYPEPGRIVCPYCGTHFQSTCLDPGGHDLSEIDPDLQGGCLGVFQCALYPVGTTICGHCGLVYADVFECCPRLVDLALMSYGASGDSHGPRTDERIAEFLKSRPSVVANTIRRRAFDFECNQIDNETYLQLRSTADKLGLTKLNNQIR